MSLDITLKKTITTEVFSLNITHNLVKMAQEAGVYICMWRPEEMGATIAGEIIKPLQKGIKLMKSDPERFKKFNDPGGWGTFERFYPMVEAYLEACIEHPDAEISVWR